MGAIEEQLQEQWRGVIYGLSQSMWGNAALKLASVMMAGAITAGITKGVLGLEGDSEWKTRPEWIRRGLASELGRLAANKVVNVDFEDQGEFFVVSISKAAFNGVAFKEPEPFTMRLSKELVNGTFEKLKARAQGYT